MISKNTHYAVAHDTVVIFKGSAKIARKFAKVVRKNHPGTKVQIWNSPSSKVGDTITH